jgi:coproporphyrinogen III oxidase-like Fe-S oxidoreductase
MKYEYELKISNHLDKVINFINSNFILKEPLTTEMLIKREGGDTFIEDDIFLENIVKVNSYDYWKSVKDISHYCDFKEIAENDGWVDEYTVKGLEQEIDYLNKKLSESLMGSIKIKPIKNMADFYRLYDLLKENDLLG